RLPAPGEGWRVPSVSRPLRGQGVLVPHQRRGGEVPGGPVEETRQGTGAHGRRCRARGRQTQWRAGGCESPGVRTTLYARRVARGAWAKPGRGEAAGVR